jgi:hypothetical protein
VRLPLRRRRLAAGARPLRELSVAEAREAEQAAAEQREPEPVALVRDLSLHRFALQTSAGFRRLS